MCWQYQSNYFYEILASNWSIVFRRAPRCSFLPRSPKGEIFDWLHFRVVSNPLNLGDVGIDICNDIWLIWFQRVSNPLNLGDVPNDIGIDICNDIWLIWFQSGFKPSQPGRCSQWALLWRNPGRRVREGWDYISSLIFSRHVFCLNLQCDNVNIIFISQFSILGFQIAPSDLHLGLTPEGGQPVLTGLGPLRTHDRWTNKLEQLYDVFLLQPPLSLISLLRTHDRRWTAGQL